MRKKSIRLKNVFAIAFLIASLFLFAFQVFSVAPGGVCYDCGNDNNCQNGNGLLSGYDSCEIVVNSNGTPIDCVLGNWGCAGSAS